MLDAGGGQRQVLPILEGQHGAVALQLGTQSSRPAELEKGSDRGIVASGRKRRLCRRPHRVRIGLDRRSQPAGVRMDGRTHLRRRRALRRHRRAMAG